MRDSNKNNPKVRLSELHFKPCPKRPNCVNSEAQDDHFVEPLRFSGDPETVWKKVQRIIVETGGKITLAESTYLHAIYTSKLLRFKDDVELYLAVEEGCIQIRSASRTGYSDFGVNRARVEKIRELLTER